MTARRVGGIVEYLGWRKLSALAAVRWPLSSPNFSSIQECFTNTSYQLIQGLENN